MTQTTNYALPQWEAGDQIRRADFNGAMAAVDAALPPRGLVALWSGAADAIPSGWALCDGENGTPDLRDRFVVGAGGEEYAVGDTGGYATIAAETRRTGNYTPEAYYLHGSYTDNRPPYYALCFIMKL